MHIKKVQDWARNHQVKGAKLGKIRQKKGARLGNYSSWEKVLNWAKIYLQKGAKLDK